jgi:hypothetical protein
MQTEDLIWMGVSFVLTLLVFSYLLGENPVFRVVSYIFVGVAAGYIAVVVIYQVLLPRLVWPMINGGSSERLLVLIPLLLSALLLAKMSARLSPLGNIPMAFLVGVGAAVIIGGAVLGTLIGQVRASIHLFDPAVANTLQQSPALRIFEGLVFLVGTVSSLMYFQFSINTQPGLPPKNPAWLDIVQKIGKVFIAITLGALFAGVYAAATAALIDRLDFIVKTIGQFL